MTARFYFLFRSDTFSSTPHNSRSVPHSAQTADSDYLNLMDPHGEQRLREHTTRDLNSIIIGIVHVAAFSRIYIRVFLIDLLHMKTNFLKNKMMVVEVLCLCVII